MTRKIHKTTAEGHQDTQGQLQANRKRISCAARSHLSLCWYREGPTISGLQHLVSPFPLNSPLFPYSPSHIPNYRKGFG